MSTGESVTLNLTVLVIGTGNITNIVNVTTDEPNTGDPDDNETVIVNDTVNVSIVKVANVTVVSVGDNVLYTITVTNNGLTNATGVFVIENLTNNSKVQFVSANASKGSYNNVSGIWNIGDLGTGESVSLNITVLVVGNGSILNVANVTTNEPNTGDPEDNETVTVNNTVNVSIVKVANVTVASVGDNVLYTITVTNNGLTNATGVFVIENLTNNSKVQFVSANASKGIYNNVSGIWNIGDLSTGESVTLNLTVLVTGTGNITNIVNVTTDEPNTGDPDDNETVVVNDTVNVSIVKVANVTVVSVGGTVLYTITVTNNGLTNASGVFVIENLTNNSKVQFVSANASKGSYNNVSGVWNIGDLGTGESVSLNITVLVVGNGSILNVVNVTTDEPNTGDPEDNETVVVNDTVNVSIVKVANVTVVSVGDNVLYTITVTNNGLTNATGVFVIENLTNNSKVQFVSANASKGIYNNVSGIWNIGDLNTGESVTLNLTVLVTGTGNITNIANVTTKENNTGDPDDNETVTVNDTVNVSIVKVANVTVVSVGDNVLYTITVANNGLTNATGVFVIENLTNNNKVQFVSANASKGSYNNVTGIWNIGDLSTGESVSLNITVLVVGNGSILNVVNVTTDEPNTGDPDDNDTVTVNDTVNVSIVKVANVTVVSVGDNVLYTITVTNNGLTNASGVFVIENLTNNSKVQFVSASTSKGSYNSGTGVWNIGDLSAHESVSLNVIVLVVGNGSILNVVNVTTDEPNNGTPTDNVTVVVNDTVNVSIVKVANVSVASVGDTVVYTITVVNNGLTNASGVYVVDGLDYSKLQYVSSNAGIGSYDPSTGKWVIGNLAAGKTTTLNITVLVTGTGNILNIANVTTDEPNNGTPTDNVTVNVNDTVNVNIVKIVNVTTANVGDTVLYTITVSNNGLNNATGVYVIDNLDYTKLQFISANATRGEYNATTGLWTIGNLAAGEILTLKITTLVTGTGNILNLAKVITDEPNTGNDSDDAEVTVNKTQEPEPEEELEPQPKPQPIPQPDPQPKPQPIPQPNPQPDPQPIPQPEPQSKPQPISSHASMKTTGIPIILLVITLVLGGITVIRRKD
ncbi:large cysteine-rich periplasmic protein OmcB, serovars L1/L3 precursor [Methanobrevibacter filiformis]|uniref:Large cysteine-rich periplasmic protein OmcB, serovars L1/L3 n=1 Tax=Methanobrevibacter filiformis TaxID=55758 RepID=A0A166EV38_9EURY|nr:large cysteine-rich periplasmic protein OmcB, serovars L1/L3 precursor [Methanobrevibacter filiformis]